MTVQPLVLVELNEVNFEYIRQYQARGELPNLRRVMDRHGCQQTSSEYKVEEVEPWIQWVTVHTGRSLAKHGIFRLGDMVESDVPQVWEELEARGITVGAVSPMNGANRLKQPAFFLPDQWTDTQTSAPVAIRNMQSAIVQAVNDNAQGRLTFSSFMALLKGAAIVIPFRRVGWYVTATFRSRRQKWWKALILDRLLTDTFLWLMRRQRPGFATLFLNGGAHIQHHYLFNSAAYQGANRNPEWYVARDSDPVLDAFRVYDQILGDVMQLCEGSRVVIATALHQDPCESIVYYWRLKDHAGFLRRLGIAPSRVLPRMSRDFLAEFDSSDDAAKAAATLSGVTDEQGRRLFDEIDNRGHSLFVSLTYPHALEKDTTILWPQGRLQGFEREAAFVAIKNAYHNGVGYLIDSHDTGSGAASPMPLSSLKGLVLNHFALHDSGA